MKMYLLQYQGIGPLSRIIKRFTRSKWSHSAVAYENSDGSFTFIEAWGLKGVVVYNVLALRRAISINHLPGTVVEVAEFEVAEEPFYRSLSFAMQQDGKKYGWGLIWKFVTRKTAEIKGKWICSVLSHVLFKKVDILLQNESSAEVSPHHLGISPVIKKWTKIRTR